MLPLLLYGYLPHECMVSALTHITRILRDFDVANLLQYRTVFVPMLFQWSHSHMARFLLRIHCDFLQCSFFALDPFLLHDFCSVERFFMLNWLATVVLFYHLIVFPIDNRYEYILMHFKGSTDLVNSAT